MRIASILLLCCATLQALAQSVPTDTLGEAVVTGTRASAIRAQLPTTVSIVDRDALTAHERGNVLPTLSEQVPGVFVTSRGILGYGVSDGAAGGINIRGMQSGSGRVLVLIDGHPQYQGIFGHAISDAYHTLGVERVEVVRGPASMLYGSNGMGGVVNLITRQSRTDGAHTDLHAAWGSFGTFEASIANRLRYGKFHSAVGGGYQRTDGHRARLGFEGVDLNAKLGYDFSEAWKAEAVLHVTQFRAKYPGSTSAPIFDARQNITRAQASLNVDNDYGFTSGRISVFHNWGRHNINDGHAADAAPKTYLFHSFDALSGVSIYQNFALVSGNTLTLGFDYQRIRGESWNKRISDGARISTSVDTTLHEVAGYIDMRQEIARCLTLEAGVRLDNHSQTGSEWIPMGGITLRLPYQNQLRATVSKGFRNPTLRELYMWRPANRNLLPERLVNYELAWSGQSAKGKLRYGVNVYYMHANNLIQTAMVDGAPRNVNTGKAENYGIEADATWNVARWLTVTTNHSFIHMKQPLLDTPRYKGYVGITTHVGKWQATVGAQAIGRLYTEVGSVEHHESFVLLDATLSYHVLPTMTLYVKGDNLLAQRYETRRGYPMPRATFMGGVNLNF